MNKNEAVIDRLSGFARRFLTWLRDIFGIIFSGNDHSISKEWKDSFYGGCFFTFISLILTIMNIARGYRFMAGTTTILMIGFASAAILARKKMTQSARVIMALLVALVFSVYAVTGENEGFAILWILLVPIVSFSLLGLKIGFFVSLYFLIFLMILFYSPLSSSVRGYYTETMIMRFPLLYLGSFGSITFLMAQRQQLYQQVQHDAYYDALTGMYNRHYFNEIRRDTHDMENYSDLGIVVVDLNRVKHINDTVGHDAGDEVIAAAAGLIRKSFPQDLWFRTGGDEFMVVCNRKDVPQTVRQLRTEAEQWSGRKAPAMYLSAGYALKAEHPEWPFSQLASYADQQMYLDKDEFYRTNQLERRSN